MKKIFPIFLAFACILGCILGCKIPAYASAVTGASDDPVDISKGSYEWTLESGLNYIFTYTPSKSGTYQITIENTLDVKDSNNARLVNRTLSGHSLQVRGVNNQLITKTLKLKDQYTIVTPSMTLTKGRQYKIYYNCKTPLDVLQLRIKVNSIDYVFEKEPNNTQYTAQEVGDSIRGYVESNDLDWYKYKVPADGILSIGFEVPGALIPENIPIRAVISSDNFYKVVGLEYAGNSATNFTVSEGQEVYVKVAASNFTSEYDHYLLTFNHKKAAVELESNDTITSANVLKTSVCGTLYSEKDKDTFSYITKYGTKKTKAKNIIEFKITNAEALENAKFKIQLYDSKKKLVKTVSNVTDTTRITINNYKGQLYYIKVSSQTKNSMINRSTYTLEVSK